MVSLGTVYKTLDLLKKMGIVTELNFPDGSRYDTKVEKHINLVCLSCNIIEDVDENSLNELEARIAKKSKYHIISGRFELYGYCTDCRIKLGNSIT